MDVWYSKWSHWYKSKKFQRLRLKSQISEIFSLRLKKWCWRNKSSKQKGCQNNKYWRNSSLSVSLIRKQSCHTHKRTLSMEEPVSNSQRKRKTQNTFSVINKESKEYLQHEDQEQMDTSILLCYNPMDLIWWKLKDRG